MLRVLGSLMVIVTMGISYKFISAEGSTQSHHVHSQIHEGEKRRTQRLPADSSGAPSQIESDDIQKSGVACVLHIGNYLTKGAWAAYYSCDGGPSKTITVPPHGLLEEALSVAIDYFSRRQFTIQSCTGDGSHEGGGHFTCFLRNMGIGKHYPTSRSF